MHLQGQAELAHARQYGVDVADIGDAGVCVRGRARGVQLAAVHHATGHRAVDFVGSGPIRQVQGHQRSEPRTLWQRRHDACTVLSRRIGGGHRRFEIRHHDGARETRRGERQHGFHGGAIAQVQVPVVGTANFNFHDVSRRLPNDPEMTRDLSAKRAVTRCADWGLLDRKHLSTDHTAPCFPSPNLNYFATHASTARGTSFACVALQKRICMTEIMKLEDLDPIETREWIESIDSVLKTQGAARAHYLLEQLIDHTRRSGAYLPFRPNTAYLNTITPGQEPSYPGNREMEKRIEACIRWNALAMVLNANKVSSEYGGHLSTYASSATLYEVGFNHFWRAQSDSHPGDMVFVQGHASPGIYARAYLEGRLSEDQLKHFRQEASGDGLSSYPHPWLMPNFWQFPTVSMGLGPMMAIYQARFQRYMENREMVPVTDRKVWAFLGDGEMDEPESMGALTLPVREKLDNLVFVVNCNLQRLDGPVRGNGKIIQELEAAFMGAGWNVIKVVWGSRWDPLLARDTNGLLRKVMEECVDGEYQNFKAKGGAYTRENFFGKFPELKEMVANMSDDDIWRLSRGGHDSFKVHAAYQAAMNHKGQPTVILAKTVKGFGLGKAAEGQMVAHQQKKLDEEALRAVRDRFNS